MTEFNGYNFIIWFGTISIGISIGVGVSLLNGQGVGGYEHAFNQDSHEQYHATHGFYGYLNKHNNGNRHHHPHQPPHYHGQNNRIKKEEQNQQEQNNQWSEREKANKLAINDLIRQTFNVSSQSEVQLFNNTLNTLLDQSKSSHKQLNRHYQASLSSPSCTSRPTPSSPPSTTSSGTKFKIQRSPDGKLNIVFDNFVQLQPSEYSNGANGKRGIHPGRIMNPHKLMNSRFRVTENDCLEQGNTFCHKIRNYPDLSTLNDILKSTYPNLGKYAMEDELIVQNISQRMNIGPDEEYLCKSRQKVLYPEAAQNKEANWFLIINNSDFKQGVRVEECITEGDKCSPLMTLPSGYYATCKQSYIYRSLVALTEDAKIFNDQFKLPSCCKCVLKNSIT